MAHQEWHAPDGVADAAFALGVVALVFVFVPVIGDFVAVPAAIAAVGLGLFRFASAEGDHGTSPWKALAGALMGLVSLFVTFITFAAMGTFG